MLLKRIAAAALIAGSFLAGAAQAQTLRFGHANSPARSPTTCSTSSPSG